MPNEKITKIRLILNAIGCIVAIAFCLLVSISLGHDLASLPPPLVDDEDGNKATAIYLTGIVIFGLLAIAAFISLVRTLRAWRSHRPGPR